MLYRCYNPETTRFERYGGRGVEVCPEWYNLQIFCKWSEFLWRKDFQIDKDILSDGSGKLYSPKNCCFIPKLLNSTLSSYPPGEAGLPRGVSLYKKKGIPNGRFVSSGYKQVCGKNTKFHLGTYTSEIEAFSAYKDFKENHIKYLACGYLNIGEITEEIFDCLIRWEVKPYD
jgi:hypothetical protein